jgi:hypothetical protein
MGLEAVYFVCAFILLAVIVYGTLQWHYHIRSRTIIMTSCQNFTIANFG